MEPAGFTPSPTGEFLVSPRRPSIYSPHPALEYVQSVLRNLGPRTGRTAEEWVRLLEKEGLEDPKARVAWLKEEHDLGGTTAWTVAEFAGGEHAWFRDAGGYLEEAERLVEQMYAGKKAGLRPLHEALIELALELGEGVRICPCKTIVPLYRQRVFAEIKPATQKRIDLGLALKDSRRKLPARLLETGGLRKGNRITHRIPITVPGDIDAGVRRWLEHAYELDG